MKAVGLGLALQIAILAVAFTAAGNAEDKDAGAVPKQELDAKLAYCKTCHGVSGQGFRGSFPMPRLAGQQPEYLENQLQAFIERRPSDRIGVVLFSGRAYTMAPLTTDHAWLAHQLERVKIGLIEDGTAIGSAIALSRHPVAIRSICCAALRPSLPAQINTA